MQNITCIELALALVLFLSTSITFINLILFLASRKKEKVRPGDLVFYKDENMITMVLVDISDKAVTIRTKGTTTLVSRESLVKLPVHKHLPLLVPEKPKAEVTNKTWKATRVVVESEEILPDENILFPGNQARFFEIPLSWFNYKVLKTWSEANSNYFLSTSLD